MTARRTHYGEFYGETELETDLPIVVVSGNCQAESLRVMLDGPDVHAVRIPPVFELVADDVPHLQRLLARTSILVSQPVHDDYHGLPIGTSQLAAALGSESSVVRMPVVRFAGLYPFSVIVRPPGDEGAVPPIVPYLDLRTMARADVERGGDAHPESTTTVEMVRRIADDSLAELTAREQRHKTIVVSDLLARATFELMRTMNHPGNPVWALAARRVREALALAPWEVDPGRALLDSVHAPRDEIVIEAFGLDARPRPDWLVGGVPVEAQEVERAHLAWYVDNPHALDAGLARHRRALETLGLVS